MGRGTDSIDQVQLIKKDQKHHVEQNVQVQSQQYLTAEQEEQLRQEKIRQEQRLKPAKRRGIIGKTKNLFSKTKKEKAFGIRQDELHDNFSDVRALAFQKQLQVNVLSDLNKSFSPDVHEVLEKINEYAMVPLDREYYFEQSAKLNAATQAISECLNRYNAQNKEQWDPNTKLAMEQLEMYRMYFDTFTNGNLKVPEGAARDYTGANAPKVGSGCYYRDASKECLFPHEPTVNDIAQGGLGDCYLLSGTSSKAMIDPEFIKKSMWDDGQGHVTVRFFKKGMISAEDLPEQEQNLYKATVEKKLPEMSDQELIFRLLTSGCGKIRDDWKVVCACSQQNIMNIFVNFSNELHAAVPKGADGLPDPKEKVKATEKNEKATAGVEFLNELLDIDFNSVPAVCKLAEAFSKNSEFVNQVVGGMRKMMTDPKATADVILKEGINLFLRNYVANADLSTGEIDQVYRDLKKRKRENAWEKHPVYVTVDKSVPTDEDGDAYSKDALWVQMLEKAYVASGLHVQGGIEPETEKGKKEQYIRMLELRNEMKKTDPSLSSQELDAYIYQKKKEYMKTYARKYQSIEAGSSSEFLEIYTGVQSQDHKLDNVFCSIAQLNSGLDHLMKLVSAQLSENPAKAFLTDKKTIEALQKAVKDQLVFMHVRVSVSMVMNCFRNYKTWMGDLKGVKKKYQLSSKELDRAMKGLIEKLPEVIEAEIQAGKLKIQYDPMSGKYTNEAKAEYAAIEKALKSGIPVNVSTIELKKGKKTGLNGEPVEGGMVGKHAYAVVGVIEMDNKKFVKLRNPWGYGGNTYLKYTRPGEKPVYKSKMGKKSGSKKNGIFYLELNEFLLKSRTLFFNSETEVKA